MGLDRCSILVEGLDHPEGVCVDAEGTLYAGGEAGQIYRIGSLGSESRVARSSTQTSGRVRREVVEVANTGGFVLGLAADARGMLYVCDVGRREVLLVDPRAGSVEVYSNGTPERPMVNPNWPVFDDDGTLYVTDSGHWKRDDGCIWAIEPGGRARVLTEDARGFPNGACLTADGSALLVLESTTPALVRIGIDDGARTLVCSLPSTVPDGITLDTQGNAYVCYYRPDRIDRIAPDGSIETIAEDPQGTVLSAPTNGVWFDGGLVTGNLGRWHLTHVELDAQGVALRYPAP